MLAQGSGDIYQIARVFRDDPCANWHQPSFMMLEWYQLGINEQQLINECVALLNFLGCSYPIHRLHYAQLFTKFCQLDVLNCELQDLQAYLQDMGHICWAWRAQSYQPINGKSAESKPEWCLYHIKEQQLGVYG